MYLSQAIEEMKKGKYYKRECWNNIFLSTIKNGDDIDIVLLHTPENVECLHDIIRNCSNKNADIIYGLIVADDFVEFTPDTNTKRTSYNFDEAFKLMKKGYKVKLPSWGGYWYWGNWSNDKETIIIHTKDNKELDIRETDRVEYTILNILSDEWIVADETNCPELGGVAEFSFSEALKYLKRGMKVARKGWHKNNMYLTMQFPDENSKMTNPYIYINVTDNYRIPWTASQADMFEEDWVFVN